VTSFHLRLTARAVRKDFLDDRFGGFFPASARAVSLPVAGMNEFTFEFFMFIRVNSWLAF
jgi:hypothetical protein